MGYWRKGEAAIWDLINDAFLKMTIPQKRVWELAKILPEKWSYEPKPSLKRKVWVVGVIGKQVVWYDDVFNEMDDDFCVSEYERYGDIGKYGGIKPGNKGLEGVIELLRLRMTDPNYN